MHFLEIIIIVITIGIFRKKAKIFFQKEALKKVDLLQKSKICMWCSSMPQLIEKLQI